MRRLSDTINATACADCGKLELDVIHSSIAGSNINTLVRCDACGFKDALIFRAQDLLLVEGAETSNEGDI